jgi:hypothetical protein
MLFPIRQETLTQYTGTATPGNTISFSITRNFFLSSVLLKIPITLGGTYGSAATFSTMGLVDLVQRVQLSINDGTSNRNQTDATGGALVRRSMRICNGVDTGTIAALGASLNRLETTGAGDSAGNYIVTIPLLFRHPQISDPIGSALMLPLPRYNTNPSLNVTFGQKSNVILSGATGATVTIGNPYICILKRQVDVVTFPTLDTEFREISTPVSSTGPNQLQNLDVPGNYTMIDYFCTNSSGIGADLSGGNTWNLQYLSNVLRQFVLADLKTVEQMSMGNDSYLYNAAATTPANLFTDLLPGYYHQDFLHDEYGMEVGELGSVLNVNVLAGSGSQLQVLFNATSTGSISFAFEKIMGDLSGYAFNMNTLAG